MPRKSGLKFSVKRARICQGASARVPVLNVPLGSPLNDSKPAFACDTVRVPHAAHLVKKALAEEHLGRQLTWVAPSRAEPCGLTGVPVLLPDLRLGKEQPLFLWVTKPLV